MMTLLSLMLAGAALEPTVVVKAEPVPTATVLVGDLDLATRDGQRAYRRRLGAALEEVCGSYANAVQTDLAVAVADCRRDATASADRQLAERMARRSGAPSLVVAARR